VITSDDVSRITIFAELDEDDRVQLARAAADLTLAPGEFAAEQGAERALFGLIEGCIEAVQTVDGVERVVGRRDPGEIFGEVPITLGTVFPVGFRACEASRVMRIGPRNFHTVAAAAPDVAKEVGRLAAHRMTGPGGLQGLASDPVPPRAIVVGERTDAACTEVRHFLDRNQIVFEWLTSETPDLEERWGGPGPVPAPEDQPAVRVIGGKMVIRPQLRRLAELLGLGTEPEAATYDVVIVGAGPAGLAAGVYGASEGLSTIVVERAAPGGQAGTSSRIENYLGFPAGVSGDELAGRALQQARRLGAEILVTRTISRIDADRHQVYLDGGDVLHGRTIVLACGVSWRNLDVPGFGELTGRGVYYGASPSDATATHGLDVHVIGAGNSGGQAAMFFSNHARSVTIVCRGESLEKSMSSYLIRQLATRSNVNVRLRSEIVAAHGDGALEEVEIRDHARETVARAPSGGVYIFIGADAETSWLPPEIAVDQRGFVLTGAEVRDADWARDRDPYLLETSVPGIFACGDVRSGPVKRVAAAVGEGSMAIAFIHQYLRDEQRAAAAPA
jgi:thioredoxin reductase (NADPH)